MTTSLPDRVAAVEDRLARLEERLAGPDPVDQARSRSRVRRTPGRYRGALAAGPNLEELFGGRLLAWLGGSAVLLGVVFFVATAVSRGWIDEPTRVLFASLGSTALLAGGLWLYERGGRAPAALAMVATALASLYASLTAATALYHLVPAGLALAVAALVGAVGTAIAVRWNSPFVGGIGLLGALLAPVLVDAGPSSTALAFMAVALVSTTGVLLWQRWNWLALAAFAIGVPQLVRWGVEHRETRLALTLAVLAGFWALFVAAAAGYELRTRARRIRLASASLLFGDAVLLASGGYALLADAGHNGAAKAWVLGAAAAQVCLGVAVLVRPVSRDVGALLVALGVALSAIGFALALSGPALVTGWAVHAVVLAWLARRTRDERAALAAAGFLAAAAAHVLAVEAPPVALQEGVDELGRAVAALAVVATSSLLLARLASARLSSWRPAFETVAAAFAVYLASVAIVDWAIASGSDERPQAFLSAFWAVTGLAALVAGLVTGRQRLRLGGLALLALVICKLFLYDLSALESLYRVLSLVAVGLLLLAGAYAYGRVGAKKEVTS